MAYYGFPYRPVRKWSTKLVVYWKHQLAKRNLWYCTSKIYLSRTGPHKDAFVPQCLNGLCGLFESIRCECVLKEGELKEDCLYVCQEWGQVHKEQAGIAPPTMRPRETPHGPIKSPAEFDGDVCCEGLLRTQSARTSARTSTRVRAHTQVDFSAVTPKTQTIQTLPPNGWAVQHFRVPPLLSLFFFFSLPLLHSLSHFPPPSKFNLTHEKMQEEMASLGRPLALIRHTHPFTKGNRVQSSSVFTTLTNDWSVFEAQPKVSHYRRYMAQQQLGLRDICKSTRIWILKSQLSISDQSRCW